MRYPNLVPDRVCKTQVHVCIYSEGISEDGAPVIVLDADKMCNYQDSEKTVLTAEQKVVQLSGCALFNGDIAPGVSTLSGGTLIVFGVERRIFQGFKCRNPDGTVNYTRLDVV